MIKSGGRCFILNISSTMKTHKKVLIIGHFAQGQNMCDGQTVKTLTLYEELKKKSSWTINIVDTYMKKNPIRLLFTSLKAILTHKQIIVLLSGNGMSFYFPLLYFFTKVFKKEIYHDVIGGNLDQYVKDNPKFKKYLNSFEVNWVETHLLKKKLEDVGVTNCVVIPNFKRLPITQIEVAYHPLFKFVLFSRVMKEKGVEEAIEAVQLINLKNKVCQLDIYGPIDEQYKERFDFVMKHAPEEVSYKGVVNFNESVSTLKHYDALLFPTTWKGEGFPGTLIDAFSSGLPVIASRWASNEEIVVHGQNGWLYPKEDIMTLRQAMLTFMYDTEILTMKKHARESAQLYQPDRYIQMIIDTLERR